MRRLLPPRRIVKAPSALATLVFLVSAIPALAQRETGALHGSVTAQSGDPLPGVLVEVTGLGAPRQQVTDARGLFRFLGLDPGRYALQASQSGFADVSYSTISIQIDSSTELRIRMSPELSESITVDAESPLLDERKLSQGTHVSRRELEAIPTARDPWAVLNQAPGVLTDQIDVGGTRATQADFSAFGTNRRENDYQIDGVQITDMVGPGFSSTYFDFDQFEEIQVSTGGSDVTKNTAGVALNLVTRRGSNSLRGTARYLRTDNSWQSTPDVDVGDFGPGQDEVSINELEALDDYGLELGGPVVEDRFWLWGSFGEYDIRDLALGGGRPQRTEIIAYAGRANAQLSSANSAVVSLNRTNKKVIDRQGGPPRAREALWQQSGPTPILKIENTHVIRNNLILTGTFADVDGGFEQIPNGGIGPDSLEPLIDADGIVKNNFSYRIVDRPSEELRLSLSWFLGADRTDHELTFGARRRNFESIGDASQLPGRQVVHVAGEAFGGVPGIDFLIAERGAGPPTELQYTSAWVQDTVRRGNWTFNLGARYDLQEGRNPAASVAAHPAFPDVLPAIEFAGNDGGGFEWSTVLPRLGVTYALGAKRETLLRASYSRFAEALGRSDIARVNPLDTAVAEFVFFDGNDNNIWDSLDIDGPPILLGASGFDPDDPSTADPDQTDPGLEPGLTDELVLAAEHAIRPELVVGATVTLRKSSNGTVERTLVRDAAGVIRPATADDYAYETTLTPTLPNGQTSSVDFYSLRPGIAFTGGTLLTNGEADSQYRGLSLTARKRYSHGWSLRGYVNWGDAELDLPESEAFLDDPTRTGFDVDGDSTLAAGWSFNVNGLVSIAPERRWGFDVSGNLYGRQGYPLPYTVSFRSPLSAPDDFDRTRRTAWAVSEFDDFRSPDLVTLDLSVLKTFTLGRDFEVTVNADLFNVLNETTALRRETRLDHPRADFLDETLSPRIWRFGLRLAWR